MGRSDNLYKKILFGRSDSTIKFEALCHLLLSFGFAIRIKGSHHIFRKKGVQEKINIQKDGNKAKSYQVKQVRNIILKYKLKV